MQKGFTIIEVCILLVIFLIVAILVAPFSFDDTRQAKDIEKWKNVQTEFNNIMDTINLKKDDKDFDFNNSINLLLDNNIKAKIDNYQINYMNGTHPTGIYNFTQLKQTLANAVISYKPIETTNSNIKGIIMYDVNGIEAPNTWGRDVFGLNVYSDKVEPFCYNDTLNSQIKDCSRSGTGLCCSNYYLVGGNFAK